MSNLLDGTGDGQGWHYGWLDGDDENRIGNGHVAYSGPWYWQSICFFTDVYLDHSDGTLETPPFGYDFP